MTDYHRRHALASGLQLTDWNSDALVTFHRFRLGKNVKRMPTVTPGGKEWIKILLDRLGKNVMANPVTEIGMLRRGMAIPPWKFLLTGATDLIRSSTDEIPSPFPFRDAPRLPAAGCP